MTALVTPSYSECSLCPGTITKSHNNSVYEFYLRFTDYSIAFREAEVMRSQSQSMAKPECELSFFGGPVAHTKLLPWIDSYSFLPDFLLVFPCLPVVLSCFLVSCRRCKMQGRPSHTSATGVSQCSEQAESDCHGLGTQGRVCQRRPGLGWPCL